MDMFGCQKSFVKTLEDHQVIEQMIIFFGAVIALNGFYYGCKMELSDEEHSRLRAAILMVLGVAGVFLMAIGIALYITAEERRKIVARRRQLYSNALYSTVEETNRPVGGIGEVRILEDPPSVCASSGATRVSFPGGMKLTIDNGGNLRIVNSQDIHDFQRSRV